MKKSLLLLLVLMCSPAWAAFDNLRIGTWNLQGSSASTENKWNIHVRQLISGAAGLNILMIQEAGRPPESAAPTGRQLNVPGIPVQEFTWNLGSNSRPMQVFIYHAAIDVFAGRVNLAIVTDRQADTVFVVNGPTLASRPALGISVGGEFFINMHALARGGSDASLMVDTIFRVFQNSTIPTTQAANFLIAGDFNRPPAQLRRDLEPVTQRNVAVIAPEGVPTQRSGGTLDYAVIGNAIAFTPPNLSVELNRGRLSQLASDHYPVTFSDPGRR